jgi:hypothetical protein
MRVKSMAAIACGFVLAFTGAARADDAKAKEVIAKAIEAHGGEAEMKKLDATSMKMKGTIHVMGMDIPFTGDAASQGLDKRKIDLEIDVMNQKIRVTNVFNKDKGWAKVNDDVKEMDKDQLAEATEQAHSQLVATLIPLKDKAYTLSVVGDEKVGNAAVTVIRVERKGRRDVTLSFDKKTYLLLKTERRVKDEMSGQEVTEEGFYLEYNDKGLRQPKKLSVKRDGKIFVEAEVVELTTDVKFDEKGFEMP